MSDETRQVGDNLLGRQIASGGIKGRGRRQLGNLRELKSRVPPLKRTLDAFRSAGGSGKPIFVQSAISFAATNKKAVAQAHDHCSCDACKPICTIASGPV